MIFWLEKLVLKEGVLRIACGDTVATSGLLVVVVCEMWENCCFYGYFPKQKSQIFSGAHCASGWLHTNVVEHSEPCCSRRTWKHICYPRHLKVADFFSKQLLYGWPVTV